MAYRINVIYTAVIETTWKNLEYKRCYKSCPYNSILRIFLIFCIYYITDLMQCSITCNILGFEPYTNITDYLDFALLRC